MLCLPIAVGIVTLFWNHFSTQSTCYIYILLHQSHCALYTLHQSHYTLYPLTPVTLHPISSYTNHITPYILLHQSHYTLYPLTPITLRPLCTSSPCHFPHHIPLSSQCLTPAAAVIHIDSLILQKSVLKSCTHQSDTSLQSH